MTVKELITELRGLPSHFEVFIRVEDSVRAEQIHDLSIDLVRLGDGKVLPDGQEGFDGYSDCIVIVGRRV